MSEILEIAIETVTKSKIAYCKFITANDVGSTKAHQYGYHIHKAAWKLMFPKPGVKGDNMSNYVSVKWQNDFTTSSRFIYYGVGTRDEYRLTRFGKNFPFLKDENFGDLLILCKIEEVNYEAFVLSTEDEINSFLAGVGISITETNNIIPKSNIVKIEKKLQEYFEDYIQQIKSDFPSSLSISNCAKEIFNTYYSCSDNIILKNLDKTIVGWLNLEYQLFKTIENKRYDAVLKKGFKTVEELVKFSNTLLNRRKSRAGKSLENHLTNIFTICKLKFDQQVRTEGRKKPDFIFPGGKEYHDANFIFSDLVFLGAKTTCKDRWRQIINEANRIPDKHLFTLQQGISSNQLKEMKSERVTLVVPKEYLNFYPKEHRGDILSLNTFISMVKSKQ